MIHVSWLAALGWSSALLLLGRVWGMWRARRVFETVKAEMIAAQVEMERVTKGTQASKDRYERAHAELPT